MKRIGSDKLSSLARQKAAEEWSLSQTVKLLKIRGPENIQPPCHQTKPGQPEGRTLEIGEKLK